MRWKIWPFPEVALMLALLCEGAAAAPENLSVETSGSGDYVGCAIEALGYIFDVDDVSDVRTSDMGAWNYLRSCTFVREDREDVRAVVKSILIAARERMSHLSQVKRAQCSQTWSVKLRKIARALYEREDWGHFPYVSVENPRVELDPFSQGVFFRVEFERELTKDASNREDGDAETDCDLRYFVPSILRSDNVTFFLVNRLSDEFKNGHISPKIFPEFWLIIQHADLHCQFQEDGLELLQRYGGKVGFPARLTRSLADRLQQTAKLKAAAPEEWCIGG